MPFHKHGRQYDLVVFGATGSSSDLLCCPGPPLTCLGYTGKYTAEHITTNLPTDLKWAVAGRSHKKLEKLVADIKLLNPDRRQPGGCLPLLVSWRAVVGDGLASENYVAVS